MTDRIFYEELRATIRDAVASYLDMYTDEELRELATESLFPPKRPTLADMSDDERAMCAWMQADLPDGSRVILDRNGRADGVPDDRVTPCFDLPRLAWPGDPDY